MDLETLKECLAAIESVGGEAKEAFIWYVCAVYVGQVVMFVAGWCGALAMAAIVFRGIRYLIRSLCSSDSLRVAFNGRDNGDGTWIDAELEMARDVLKENAIGK